MRYRDVLRFSLRGIRTSPLRSALSALSVAVGTGALLIIASLGLFGRTQIENGLARIGVSGLAVSTDEGGAGTPLSAALAERMAQAVPGIKAASPVRAVGGTVRAGHRTSGVVLLGADENLGEVMQVELLAGTLPSQAQVEARAAVAVVGDELAERLYGRVNITGREIRISRNGREQIFTVCGVRTAIECGYISNHFLVLFVAVVTGVGGGVLRDIFAGDRPYIFVKHIYACASLIGALAAMLVWIQVGQSAAMLIGFIVVTAIRLLAARFRWSLPKA